jgi:hypothetical protein
VNTSASPATEDVEEVEFEASPTEVVPRPCLKDKKQKD